jgi:hypothetical protein
MALDPNINCLEKQKFAEDDAGNTCVRTCGETSITGSRAVSEQYKSVSVDDTGWTDLTALFSNVLVLSVQNNSGVQVKLNSASPAGYEGMPLSSGRERNYNDLDTGFVLQAKAQSGTISLDVEVLKNA